MIILDSTVKLQAVLSGAKATNDCIVLVDYVEMSASPALPAQQRTATNGTTAVDILAAPSASAYRLIKSIYINNADTASITVTFRTNISAAVASLFVCTLPSGYTLSYEDRFGWAVLDSNGLLQQVAAGSSYRLVKSTFITSGTSYTISVGATAIEIELIGGGGGGGGCSTSASNAASAGGGASGSYLRKFLPVVSTNTITYAIAATATGGNSSGSDGTVGNDTTLTYNGTTYTAKGGNGGVGMVFGSTVLTALGGLGVVPTNGDLNVKGQCGFPGYRLSLAVGVSGDGGSLFEARTRGSNSTSSGSQPSGNYGAGGAGGNAVGSGAATGGAGSAGSIIIHELF